jgi:hypothetical protein
LASKKNPVERKKHLWTRPAEGTHKININVDAAVNSDRGRGSLEVVARDYLGTFTDANCNEPPYVVDPFF